jgi:hypothetical protein
MCIPPFKKPMAKLCVEDKQKDICLLHPSNKKMYLRINTIVHDRVEVILGPIVGNFGSSHTAREVCGQ